MADLVPGDLVLGRDGPTTVIAVQHKSIDTVAEMLTISTTSGTSVSMTPDHALYVDGALVRAADATVGALIIESNGELTPIKRITKSKATIINAVTASGTIIADHVVVASNPFWIASVTVDAPVLRAVVNAAIHLAGDVESLSAGCAVVLCKICTATLAVGAFALRRKLGAGAVSHDML